MKALVTGGAGFVGARLVELLLVRGNEVAVVDDLSSGARSNIPAGASFPGPLDILTNGDQLERLVAWSDVIFHLAAVVGVRLVLERPQRTRLVNIDGTMRIAALAKLHSRRLIFTSSSAVYGSTSTPIAEDAASEETSRESLYGLSKWHAERQLLGSRPPAMTTVARLFNVIGERQGAQHGMVVPTFARQAVAGEDITIFGDGRVCRSYCYVSDAVEALIGLADEPQTKGLAINIGSHERASLDELAMLVKSLAQSESRIVHVDYETTYRAGYLNPPDRLPDLTLARRLIDYNPTTSLREAVASVVRHTQGLAAGEALT